jgi:hypothetical protein
MKDELPLIVRRCLAFGVKISPCHLDGILNMSNKYKIPDDELEKFSSDWIKAYIDGLYLSSQEGAGYWTKGHDILESLGFEKIERTEGHRTFVRLVWGYKS